MRKIILLCLLMLMAVAGCNPIPEDTYKVVKIKDGDTIELLGSDMQTITVRLANIDCPEKAQAYGTRARQFTAEQCFGQNVTIEGNQKDQYGRTVANVILADGRNLNHELVKNGFAWEYTAYSHDPALAALQEQARDARLGLWQDPNPTPPWKFRKNKTQKKQRKKRTKKPKTISLTGISNTVLKLSA